MHGYGMFGTNSINRDVISSHYGFDEFVKSAERVRSLAVMPNRSFNLCGSVAVATHSEAQLRTFRSET